MEQDADDACGGQLLSSGKGKGVLELTTYRGLVLQIEELSASASTVGSPTTQVEYQVFCKE